MLIDVRPLRRHRDFRLLFIGQFVSFFGSMITYVAVPYQIFQLTQSSFAVGLVSAIQLVPLLVFGLWGGAVADAMDRRKLLIGSELGLAVGSGLLVLNSWLAEPSVALVYGAAIFMSALNGFHRPALEALTPRLVERHELASVAALSSFRNTVGAIGGPALGGICIAQLGLAGTYAIDVVTFVVSLVALAMMKRMPAGDAEQSADLKAIGEGLRYAASRPVLIGTYVVDIVAMTFAMPNALLPAMSEKWGGAAALGWLYSAPSVGSFLVTVTSGWAKRVRRHGAMIVVAAALWGVFVILFGLMENFWLALFFFMLSGAADMVSAIFRSTIWNQTIPNRLRGRLAGVEMISYTSGPLLGNARAGFVAQISSVATSVVSGGVLCVVGVLACIPLLPEFWKYEAEPHPEEKA